MASSYKIDVKKSGEIFTKNHEISSGVIQTVKKSIFDKIFKMEMLSRLTLPIGLRLTRAKLFQNPSSRISRKRQKVAIQFCKNYRFEKKTKSRGLKKLVKVALHI